jgi:glycosyltransferase involved in cell wall biosynthesis
MKVALFCTNDVGGAGKAALRLHKGLSLIGEDSTFFVKHKSGFDNNVIQLHGPEINNLLFENIVQKYFVQNIYSGNTMSSMMYPSVGFNFLEYIKEYDIINLHWVSMFISVEAIVKMNTMGKPVIWTLHDQNPMTGACHYTHGCEKFQTDCSGCPQLRENSYNITKVLLETKVKYLPENLVLVAPSKWLADCAKSSLVFKNKRVEVIPNSLETDFFRPVDKQEAKESMGIPQDARVIVFGACDLKERRKGANELLKVIRYFKQTTYAGINKLIEKKQLYLLIFGSGAFFLDDLDLPLIQLGYVKHDEELSLIYSAADVLALPSLEDNLPNSLLESLSCGTPVVSFATGGMLDVIENGRNGFLVPLHDARSFAERLIDVLQGKSMSEECRRYALDHFALNVQATEYRDLFQEVIKEKKVWSITSNIPVIFPEAAQVLMPYVCEAAIEAQVEHNKLEDDLQIQKQIKNYYICWLEKILNEKEGISGVLKKYSIKSVAIFGTKTIAKYLLLDLTKGGLKVKCFLDNRCELHYTKLNNIIINPLDWLKENYTEVDAIVISIEGNHDIDIKKEIDDLIERKRPVLSWKQLIISNDLDSNNKLE